MIRAASRHLAVPRRSGAFRSRAAIALVVLLVAACGGKSDAQLATDALNAGLQAHTAGNLDEAATQYRECLEHEAANKYCLYNLGLIAQTQDRAVEAENYYRLALSQDTQYGPALFNLAILRTEAGAAQEAIALYRQYTQVQPDDAGGHLNLGLLLRANGDTAGGNAEIETALTLNPNLAVPAASPTAYPSPGPSESPDPSESASPKP